MDKRKITTLKCRLVMFALLVCFSTVSFGNPFITYVPIGVDDITIIIPVFNNDVNGDGNPDYDDPSLSPEMVFSAFSAALMTGRNDTAIKFIAFEKQERFREAFTALGSVAGSVISSLANQTVMFTSDNVVELGVNRVVNGVNRAYMITIIKNRDGVWRIADM